MSDFITYLRAQAERREAQAKLDLAHAQLDLASIRERLAEIASQHEPLASLVENDNLSDRARAIAAANYVVIGRTKP